MTTIYERIKKRRLALRLSARELADRMGYRDKSSIYRIEAGKVDLAQTQVLAFARALGTSIGYLLGAEES